MYRVTLTVVLLAALAACNDDPAYPWYLDGDASDTTTGDVSGDVSDTVEADTSSDDTSGEDTTTDDTSGEDTTAGDTTIGDTDSGVCLTVAPDFADFGTVLVGESAVRTFQLTSCGTEPVTVTSLTGVGSDDFWYDGPEPPFSMDGTASFDVWFFPETSGSLSAEFTITADGVDSLFVETVGVGRGGSGDCPVAVGGCRVADSGRAFGTDVEVAVGETIECSGAGSFGDFSIVDFAWRLVTRPLGSSSALEGGGETVFWQADTPGNYFLELDVIDSEGVTSCEPAEVDVTATRSVVGDMPSLNVHLEWNNGADVDAHLVRGTASLFSSTGDCHYASPTPSWGDPGTDDDPRLDVDDTDGFGPENINIDSVEPGVPYTAVIAVPDLHGVTSTEATVSVRVDGVQESDWTRVLNTALQEWTVFSIEFDESGDFTIEEIDTTRIGTGS